jgi:hypothetical protein
MWFGIPRGRKLFISYDEGALKKQIDGKEDDLGVL